MASSSNSGNNYWNPFSNNNNNNNNDDGWMVRKIRKAEIESKQIILYKEEVAHYFYTHASQVVQMDVELTGDKLEIALRECDNRCNTIRQFEGPGNYLQKLSDEAYVLGWEDVVKGCEPEEGDMMLIKYDCTTDKGLEAFLIYLPTY